MNTKLVIAFVILVVLFYFAEIHHLRPYGTESKDDLIQWTADGNTERRIGVLLLGLAGALLLLRNLGTVRASFGVMEIALIFFAVWMCAGTMWADDVGLTLRRTISFALLWVAATGFASEFSQRDGLRCVFAGSMTFLLFGVVAELLVGTFAPADPIFRFGGTLQPNHQAWNCCCAALSGIGLATTERHHRAIYSVCATIAIAALVLTKSRTSVAAFVFVGLLYVFLTKISSWRLVSVCISLAAIVWIGGALSNGTHAATRAILSLGRGTQDIDSLDGRTDIWKIGLEYLVDHPVAGYGFNAFETPDRIAEFERKAGWAALTLHSEYLDLLLGVGIIGAAAYLTAIIGGVIRTLRLHQMTNNRYYTIEFLILLCVLCLMLLENVGRDPNLLAFMFMVILSRRVLYRVGLCRDLASVGKKLPPHTIKLSNQLSGS